MIGILKDAYGHFIVSVGLPILKRDVKVLGLPVVSDYGYVG